MQTLTLTRKVTINGAVFGVLEGLSKPLHTLEGEETTWPGGGEHLCIPHGWEPGNPNGFHKTRVWEITKVAGREAVLFHVGNYIKDTEACVLPGMGEDQSVPMVTSSSEAIELMRAEIGENSFMLKVI